MSDAATDARQRWIAAAFALGSVALLAYFAVIPPVRYGDGWEYTYHLESLYRHGSPELRDDDLAAANTLYPPEGIDRPPVPANGYYEAKDGRWYGYHFWAYALSAVPAKAVLHALGGNELAAFQLTNAAWFLLAVGVALFTSNAPRPKRLALAGLACLGPAVWYIHYTGAETYSWSLAVMAVVAFDNRRLGWAATATGLGAIQNPPLVFLAAAFTALAAWRRDGRAFLGGCLGTGLAFLPPAFYYAHFGVPSLIGRDATDVTCISLIRSWGLATDLNQGLLPYAPLLAIGAVVGAGLLLYRRNAAAFVLLPALAAMWASVQIQANWNAGCLGLMRYLLWMVPVLAWLAVEGLRGGQTGRIFLAAAVVVQLGITLTGPPSRAAYLTHTPVARWVLTHAPWLYYPEPEIFAERIVHFETTVGEVAPVGFSRPDGYVTKLLVDPASVDRLPERFVIDPAYLDEVRRLAAGRTKPFYVHPPRNKVWAPPKPEPEWIKTL